MIFVWPMVLWALAEEIRAIGKVITGINTGKPVSMMLREARIWGPSHQNAMQNNLRRFTLAQVTEALRLHAGFFRDPRDPAEVLDLVGLASAPMGAGVTATFAAGGLVEQLAEIHVNTLQLEASALELGEIEAQDDVDLLAGIVQQVVPFLGHIDPGREAADRKSVV